MNKISIIGMGLSPEDLTSKHLELIQKADVLIGGNRHLSYFKDHPCEKIPITKDLQGLADYIRENMIKKAIVVLASGDPLYYGIGHFFTTALDPESIDIYPNISAVSAAFSRIKEAWQDAHIISLHGRDTDEESLLSALAKNDKIALFTDKKRNPAWLAKKIMSQNSGVFHYSAFKMCVSEQLGIPSEKVAWYTLEEAAEHQFSDPNLVILKRSRLSSDLSTPEHRRLYPDFGLQDHLFVHEQGLITKSEVRAITLSKLRLEPGQILWDLGAGSGSVSIEAAGFIRDGEIYAVEKNPRRIEDIQQNQKNFNITNMKVIHASLPEKMEKLPLPDRIFIGGGGSHLKDILERACNLIKSDGIIVINTVLLQNMDMAMTRLKQSGFKTDMVQIQISRSKSMPWGDRLEALNPVWIISGYH